MTYIVLGRGPRFPWLRATIAGLCDTAARGVVFPADRSPSVLEALVQQPIEALLLIDHEPRDVLAEVPPGKSLCDVVRPLATDLVFAHEIARRARSVTKLEGEPSGWSSVLADVTGASEERVGRSLSSCPPAPQPAGSGEHESAVATIVGGYLKPLADIGSFQPGGSLVWPREIFLDGDAPGMPLPPTVDVGGRPRILAYGPYLPIPVGRWTATICLGFSIDIGRLPFIFEIDAGGPVARGFFEVHRGGIFTLVLDFEVLQALHLVEVRLISQESAFEGQAALIEVKLAQS